VTCSCEQGNDIPVFRKAGNFSTS